MRYNRELIENISTSITEPVTLSEVKDHLRIDGSDEDVVVESFITAAREIAENYANRTIASQEFRLTLDQFPLEHYRNAIRLPRAPVVSVDSFTYDDSDGVNQTLSSGTGYFLSAVDYDPILTPPYNETWPLAEDGYEKVKIEFTAGYSTVPSHAKNAILMIIGDLYNNRESSAPITMHDVPFCAKSLLNPIRKITL